MSHRFETRYAGRPLDDYTTAHHLWWHADTAYQKETPMSTSDTPTPVDAYERIADGDYPGATRDHGGLRVGPVDDAAAATINEAARMIDTRTRMYIHAYRDAEDANNRARDHAEELGRLRHAINSAYPGAAAIAFERARQIYQEGHNPINDVHDHKPGALLEAGMCYAGAAVSQLQGVEEPGVGRWTPEAADLTEPPAAWPWGREYWKPSDDPARNLEKAGALIAAELDRGLIAAAREET